VSLRGIAGSTPAAPTIDFLNSERIMVSMRIEYLHACPKSHPEDPPQTPLFEAELIRGSVQRLEVQCQDCGKPLVIVNMGGVFSISDPTSAYEPKPDPYDLFVNSHPGLRYLYRRFLKKQHYTNTDYKIGHLQDRIRRGIFDPFREKRMSRLTMTSEITGHNMHREVYEETAMAIEELKQEKKADIMMYSKNPFTRIAGKIITEYHGRTGLGYKQILGFKNRRGRL
jgi:hypothetical protein